MSLLNDANFLDRDLGSTNLAMLTFDSENSAIEFLSCTGSLKVVYTNEDGDVITETYSNLIRQKIQTATRAESPVYFIGSVTELKVADTLTAIDLRALRTLKYLDLNDQADLRSINLYGCRSLESLDLTGCSQIHVLDLHENKNLESLVLANCTGLLSINLSTNLHLHTVDLTGCTGIRYLDATMLTELQSLVIDGTQLESPDNTLILIQACYGGDVIAAKEAADRAEATLEELKRAIEDLPDGQAVSVKVAEHTVALSKLHILTVDEMDTLGNYCTSLADLSEKYSVINLTFTDESGTVVCASILPSTDSEHGWLYEFQEGWRVCKMNEYEFYPENDFLDLASYMDRHSTRIATKAETGEPSDLTTEDKSSIVAGVNKVNEKVDDLQSEITELGGKVDSSITKTRNLAYPVEVLKDWYLSSDGKFSHESDSYSVLIPCEPNKTYTLSKVLTTRFRIGTFKNKPTLYAQSTLIGSPHASTSYTFTTNDEANYIMAWVLNSSGETKTIDDVLASLQLELGNEATPYVRPFVAVDSIAREIAGSVRTDFDQHIKTTNNIEIPLNAADVTKGYYRLYDGSLAAYSVYFYSKPIWLEEGEVVKTNEAITVSSQTCVVCSVDKDNNFNRIYLRGSGSAEIINFVAPYSGYFGISGLNSNLGKFVIERNGINKSVTALLEDTKGCGVQSVTIDNDQKINGFYRLTTGQLASHGSYMYTQPIYAIKGDRITTTSPISVIAQVAFISKVDKDNNFISLLKAGTGVTEEYDYEVTENCYISICTTKALSGYVLIINGNISKRVDNLFSQLNNNDNPFALGTDKLITINDNPLSMIVRGASYAGLIHSWGIVGDSLSSGEMQCYDSTSTSATDYKFVDMYQWSWGQRFAKLNGVDAYNFSNGGQTTWGWLKSQGQVHDASYIGGVGGGDWRHAQLAENRKDGYIIALAVNDRTKIQNGDYALGETSHIVQYDGTDSDIDDTSINPKSFYRYYAGIIQRLKSVSPKAKIFCVTPLGSNYNELSTAIRNIVDLYDDVYLIDLAQYCPISWSGAYYMNGHGSAMGYEYTAYEINTYIDWIIRKNFDNFKGTALIGTDYRDKF